MEATLHHYSSSSSSSFPPLIPSCCTFRPLKSPNIVSIPNCSASLTATSCSTVNKQKRIASVESQFRYDKVIPEQKIDEPVGLSGTEKEIGSEPRCGDCQAKGAVLCATCGGSGLYVDSILECQGIIIKVRCLSCGGTGNNMCSECGGRGHL